MRETTATRQMGSREAKVVLAVSRFAGWVGEHWLGIFIVVYGAWVLTPFLAPVLMEAGAFSVAHGVYLVYSFFCHQLPERSLFLFGPQPMYSLEQIKAVWSLDGFEGLRQFTGNPEMGYKVAWSDRMISFYGSLWVGGLIFALVRRRLKAPSPAVWIATAIVPVAVDGLSHMVNDIVAGTSGTGFRDTNAWLAALTGNALPQWFYAGDALGSFNSDMRWLTGILFGLSTVWFLFPLMETAMREMQEQSAAQLARARSRN